jgi:hypothetical protein
MYDNMNTTLHSQKIELAQRILGESNDRIISLMVNYLDQIQPRYDYDSCYGATASPYTDEEKRARIELAMQDYYSGNSISHEELLKDIATW